MSCSVLINSIGLILDIIGALLLFKFGLPENLDREGNCYLVLEQGNEAEKTKVKLYDFLGNIGAGMLILGFILQLISNFL